LISKFKIAKVSKVRVRDRSVWGWNFLLRRRLFEEEKESLEKFLKLLPTGVECRG
jgi:hypothetical protein